YLVNPMRANDLKIKEELEQSKIEVEAIRSTPENRPTFSRHVVNDDVQSNEKNESVNNGSGFREVGSLKLKSTIYLNSMAMKKRR
ncbi:unnamed protein product, partial [Brachionus calyciflorus]